MTLFVLTNKDYGWLFPHAWLAEQIYLDNASAAEFGQLNSTFHNFSLVAWQLRSWLFIYNKTGSVFSLWSLMVNKAVWCDIYFSCRSPSSRTKQMWPVVFRLKMQRWESDRWPVTVETEWALVDCATSSKVSEHCVPNLQGHAAQGSDCFSWSLWILSKETDRQSLISTCCLKRPEMQESLNNCSIQETFLSY